MSQSGSFAPSQLYPQSARLCLSVSGLITSPLLPESDTDGALSVILGNGIFGAAFKHSSG